MELVITKKQGEPVLGHHITTLAVSPPSFVFLTIWALDQTSVPLKLPSHPWMIALIIYRFNLLIHTFYIGFHLWVFISPSYQMLPIPLWQRPVAKGNGSSNSDESYSGILMGHFTRKLCLQIWLEWIHAIYFPFQRLPNFWVRTCSLVASFANKVRAGDDRNNC